MRRKHGPSNNESNLTAHAGPVTASSTVPQRQRALLAALTLVALTYVGLLPTIRRMEARTRELDQETRAAQTAASQTREVARAVSEARQAVSESPNSAQLHLRLAALLDTAGHLEEARSEARQAAALAPQEVAPRLLLADICQKARRFEEAFEAYDAVLKIDPKNVDALVGLGWLDVSFGWTSEAFHLLGPAVKAMPNQPRLRTALAVALIQQLDYHSAERQLLQVRKSSPNDPVSWAPIVDVYIKSHQYARALSVGGQLLLLMPDNAKLVDELAQAALGQGDGALALRYCSKLQRLAPEAAETHYRTALCYLRLHRPKEAERELEWVVTRNGAMEGADLLLGRLYLQEHRVADGKTLLDRFRKHENARQAYEKAGIRLSMHPNSANAHLAMARVYQQQGNTPRMIVELTRVLRLDGHNAAARAMLQSERHDAGTARL